MTILVCEGGTYKKKGSGVEQAEKAPTREKKSVSVSAPIERLWKKKIKRKRQGGKKKSGNIVLLGPGKKVTLGTHRQVRPMGICMRRKKGDLWEPRFLENARPLIGRFGGILRGRKVKKWEGAIAASIQGEKRWNFTRPGTGTRAGYGIADRKGNSQMN